MSGAFIFLKKWIKSPIKIGSVIPSSKALTDSLIDMTMEGLTGDYRILFVGTGTGPILKSARKYGLDPEKSVAVELDTELYNFSINKYPEFKIINADICNLGEIITTKFDRVVSALPLTIIPNADAAIQSMLNFVKEDGQLLQYSYRFYSPIDMEKYKLSVEKKKHILFNLPPARIWRYIINK